MNLREAAVDELEDEEAAAAEEEFDAGDEGMLAGPETEIPQGEVPPITMNELRQVSSGVEVPPAGRFETAAGFNPDTATFEERQKNMTPQERADWASKKFSGPVEKDPTGKAAPAPGTAKPAEGAGLAGDAPAQLSPRQRFEQEVFKQIGGDPFQIDTMKIVDDATRKELPDLFRRFFKGQAIWEDRERLNKNQAAAWQDEVKKFRAFIKEQVEGDKSHKKEVYKELMSRFDLDMKERDAQEKVKAERAKKWAEETGKAVDRQAKTVDALKRQDNTLRTSELKIMQDMAKIIGEGIGGKPKPEFLATFTALDKELERIRAERDGIRLRLDPAYREERQAQMAERERGFKEQRQQTADTKEAERKESYSKPAAAGEAPAVDEAKIQELSTKPDPKKGVPVSAERNKKTGEVRVTFKDGSQEIRK